MGGGKPVRAREKGGYGVPPLSHLRAIMDARGVTREQLASRSGLSQPTVTRVIEGTERVRISTAAAVARAVGVPVAALHDDLAYGEISGRMKLPPVVAGQGYGYPGGVDDAGEAGEPEDSQPQPQSQPPVGNGKQQYVIVHRDEWRALHDALATISGRLTEIEEAVGELATRPIAEFDVQVNLKERGK